MPSNKLFKNNGDNTFTEVAQNIGAAGPLAAGIIIGLGLLIMIETGTKIYSLHKIIIMEIFCLEMIAAFFSYILGNLQHKFRSNGNGCCIW